MALSKDDVSFKLEFQPGCRKVVHARVSPGPVKEEEDRIIKEAQKSVRIPGYRPGKAPANLVRKKFQREIEDAVYNNVVIEARREILNQQQELDILRVTEADEMEEADDGGLAFTFAIITAPQFKLPDYTSLTAKAHPDEVTEEEVEHILENLRQRAATFEDESEESAALEWGHFAVIDFNGTIDGAPIADIGSPASDYFNEGKDFWFRMDEEDEGFLPGFAEELEEMKIGETREISLPFPEDHEDEQLAGKVADFTVTLKGIKRRVLPELDDELVKTLTQGQMEDLTALREDVTRQAEERKKYQNEELITHQIMDQVLGQVETELPDFLVRAETEQIARDIVQQNQRRGVQDEELEENKPAIIASANRMAERRVLRHFVLLAIARQEELVVGEDELNEQITMMAAQYRMTADQLRNRLEKEHRMEGLREEVLKSKALEFLRGKTSVELTTEPVEGYEQPAHDHEEDDDDEHDHNPGPDAVDETEKK